MSAKEALKLKAEYFIEKYAGVWKSLAKGRALDQIDAMTEYEAAQDLAKLRE